MGELEALGDADLPLAAEALGDVDRALDAEDSEGRGRIGVRACWASTDSRLE